MLKSRPDRYGAVAVTIHWLTALAVLALLVVGFRAGNAADPAAQAGLLRVHVPLGLALLALTGLRVVWWLAFDRRPGPPAATPPWQARLARLVHGALYLVLFLMFASGIALVALSGAGPVLVSGTGTLPDLKGFAPHLPHMAGALVLIALILLHTAAALHHHFLRRDGIFRRMWYGRGGAAGAAAD